MWRGGEGANKVLQPAQSVRLRASTKSCTVPISQIDLVGKMWLIFAQQQNKMYTTKCMFLYSAACSP